jgi:integrase
MKRWCPKAGIEHVIVKDLRRAFCTRHFRAGTPELVTIRLMGHGSSAMVRQVYAKLGTEDFRAAIESLARVTTMEQQQVIPIEKRRENRGKRSA